MVKFRYPLGIKDQGRKVYIMSRCNNIINHNKNFKWDASQVADILVPDKCFNWYVPLPTTFITWKCFSQFAVNSLQSCKHHLPFFDLPNFPRTFIKKIIMNKKVNKNRFYKISLKYLTWLIYKIFKLVITN